MTKQDHIDYWIKNSKRDWNRADICFNQKEYLFGLFCVHLSLEKICKAIWVKHHKSNFPPKIHHLVRIIETTPHKISEEDLAMLNDFNKFQLEGRYPDYQDRMYKICTKKYTEELMNEIKPIKKCLLKELQ
jgi:HEPN domain-containing protein